MGDILWCLLGLSQVRVPPATAFENNVDGCEPATKRYKAASDADQHFVGEPTTYQPELHVIDSSGDEPTTKRYKAAAETLPTETNQPSQATRMRDSISPSLPKSWTLKVTAGDDVRRTDAMLDACCRWTWEKELSIAFFLDGLVSQSLGHSVLNLFKDSRLISRHLGSCFLGRSSAEQRHRHTQEECERNSRPSLQVFPAKLGSWRQLHCRLQR